MLNVIQYLKETEGTVASTSIFNSNITDITIKMGLRILGFCNCNTGTRLKEYYALANFKILQI